MAKKNKIRDRFGIYDSLGSAPADSKPAPKKTIPSKTVDGIEFDEISEGLLRLTTTLRIEQNYGEQNLAGFLPFRLSHFCRWLPDKERPESDVLPEEILFLDLETTGLKATGASTYAFLVGLGFFTGDGFCCEQYFMATPAAEPELLEHVLSRCRGFRFLFSFNGRTFDLPLLQNRYLLNYRDRLKLPLHHFDLYHILKRIFKGEQKRHKLQLYEQTLLKIKRTDDVDSSLIPQMYFDYIHYGSDKGLAQVFIHNQLDIFSLIFFLLNSIEQTKEGSDLSLNLRANLARILLRNKEHADALRLLEKVKLAKYAGKGAWAELLLQAVLCKRVGSFRRTYRLLYYIHRRLSFASLTERLALVHEVSDVEEAKAVARKIWLDIQTLYLARVEAAKLIEHHYKDAGRALLILNDNESIHRHFNENPKLWQENLLQYFPEYRERHIIRFFEREAAAKSKRSSRLTKKIKTAQGKKE